MEKNLKDSFLFLKKRRRENTYILVIKGRSSIVKVLLFPFFQGGKGFKTSKAVLL